VKFGGGAGNTVQKNVFLECYQGISTHKKGDAVYAKCLEYLNSENGRKPTDGNKDNYIGRMLQKVGKQGWESSVSGSTWNSLVEEFWFQRYPLFETTLNDIFNNATVDAFQVTFAENMFWSSIDKDIDLATSTAPTVTGNEQVDLSIFQSPENLNFKFNSNKPEIAPDIPFENIGLYLDEYRCAVPDKDEYRRAIKQRFEGQACYGGSYDPATINQRLYYNSGKMVLSLVPCQKAYVQENFYFDMGTTTSVLAAEYERVSNTTLAGPFGWTNTDNLNAADRSEFIGLTALTQDLVYCAEPKTFEVNLPNGKYKVLLTFGDARYSHDNITVKAQGETRLSNINTQKGDNFIDEEFEVEVTDSKLSLEFSDGGGTDPDWVVNRLVITKKSIISGVQFRRSKRLSKPSKRLFNN